VLLAAIAFSPGRALDACADRAAATRQARSSPSSTMLIAMLAGGDGDVYALVFNILRRGRARA
jgi:hypothetical protein